MFSKIGKRQNDLQFEYNHLFTSRSSITIFYCTVKVNKNNFPLRRIVSMHNVSNSKLTVYLINTLNNYREKSTSYIKDSFHFADNF